MEETATKTGPETGSENGFGRRLRQVRKGQALTQEDLGGIAGMAPDAISRLENGYREPRSSTVRKLAKALGVGVEVLTGARYAPVDPIGSPPPEKNAEKNGKG